MPTLLLQSCSASKNEVNRETPALELYSGYFYKIIKKSIRNDEFRSDTDLLILSAKYGILDPTDEIPYYDREMDSARAQELHADVVESIATRIEEVGYDQLVVNMGSTYREAIEGLGEHVDVPILGIPGDGIGEKGNALYRFIRGDDAVVEVMDDV